MSPRIELGRNPAAVAVATKCPEASGRPVYRQPPADGDGASTRVWSPKVTRTAALQMGSPIVLSTLSARPNCRLSSQPQDTSTESASAAAARCARYLRADSPARFTIGSRIAGVAKKGRRPSPLSPRFRTYFAGPLRVISLDTFGGPNGPLRLTYRRIRTGYASSELTRRLLSGICTKARRQGTGAGDQRGRGASATVTCRSAMSLMGWAARRGGDARAKAPPRLARPKDLETTHPRERPPILLRPHRRARNDGLQELIWRAVTMRVHVVEDQLGRHEGAA